MCGMSMEDLSESMNGAVSKQAISKYEQGKMMPNSNVLILISKALQLPVEYFFREEVRIEKISFREDPKIPARSSEQLLAMAQDRLERYLALEDLLAINNSFKNPLRRLKIHNMMI